jgi:DNA-binding PadR family transcriptional regulator
MNSTASSLELALLGLLRQKPQSGYDLRKLFATTPVRHFSDSPGSIYPALRRLQSRHWLVAARAREGARQRQVFRTTPAGNRVLGDWLRQRVTREDVVWRLNELLLRFAFFDGNVSRDVAAKFLQELERELEAYIAELRQYAADSGMQKTITTGSLAFSNGILGYQTQLSWARDARRRLSERSS